LSFAGFLQLAASTAIFVLAASGVKSWTVAPTNGKLALTLALYTIGNLIMLRLVREFGLSIAFSLSAVIQLIAVNAVALIWFGERLGWAQGIGLALAVAAVAVISFGPYLTGR
jgi:multidrug transporter EmrE-like cation transporter